MPNARLDVVAVVLGYVAVLAAGQILFKVVALQLTGLPPMALLSTILLVPSFYAACLLYAAATVLWVWVLTQMPLGVAYPFVALSFAVVPLAGWWLWGEALTLRSWLGILLIVSGVAVIATVPRGG